MITVEKLREHLAWEPVRVPAPVPVDWQEWAETPSNKLDSVGMMEDPNFSVLLRGDTVLSRVSKKYRPFHNAELLELAERATREGWAIDSFHEFGGGKSVVVNLVDADTIAAPAGHQSLVALVNSFTGREALRLLPVNRRVWCRNQLPYYSGQRSYSHPHSREAVFPIGVFERLRHELQERQEQMERWKSVKLDFHTFVQELLDVTMAENAQELARNRRREQLLAAYRSQTAPEPGTAYAAVQAAMYADQHIIGRKGWRTVYGDDITQSALAILEHSAV